MRKAIPLVIVAFAMTGCIGGLISRFTGPDPVDQYLENTQVTYVVKFHADPAVGQWATFNEGGMENWYGVVGGEAGAWLVEKRTPVPGQDCRVAILMRVDDQGMVQQAWGAKYDPEAEEKPEGKELKVMPKPEPVEGGEAEEGKKPEWSEEKACGLDCKKMTMDKSEIWFSPKVYFGQMMESPNPKGGMVKMAYDGNVSLELIEQGTEEGLEPSLTIPEEA